MSAITELVDEPAVSSTAQPAAAAAAADSDTPKLPERKPGYISIPEVSSWIGNAVKGFMLTPSDLRAIYIIVMWQFLNYHHIPEDGNLEGLPKIENDMAVAIPESELNRIVGVALNPTFRAYFLRIVTL